MKKIIRQAFDYLDRIGYPKNDVLTKEQCATLMVDFTNRREVIREKAFQNLIETIYQSYLKPLPLWRSLFCSNKSNKEWCKKRSQKYIQEFLNNK